MKLQVVMPGSRTRVQVGYCCPDPWTYYEYLIEGEDGVTESPAASSGGATATGSERGVSV